jgi:hypothetical protein
MARGRKGEEARKRKKEKKRERERKELERMMVGGTKPPNVLTHMQVHILRSVSVSCNE